MGVASQGAGKYPYLALYGHSRHRTRTHSHKTLRCRRNPQLSGAASGGAGSPASGAWRASRGPSRRAPFAGHSPREVARPSSGSCGARSVGPLGGSGMKVTSLDGRQLRKMLRKEAEARCVVLDCRPYLAFAASSVRGSLNVNLNSVVLRRARGGAVSARYVLPDEAARARLLQEGGGGVAAVVVLDQGSRHWQKLREESAARVVLTSLLACLPAGPRVYFLKGEFVREQTALCHPPLLPCTLCYQAPGLPPCMGTLDRRKSPLAGVCTPGFDVRLGGPCNTSAPRASFSPPAFPRKRLASCLSSGLGGLGRCCGRCSLIVPGAQSSCWSLAPLAGHGGRNLSVQISAIKQVETLPQESGAAVSPFFPPRQLEHVRLCLGGPLAFLTLASPSPFSPFIAFYCYPPASSSSSPQLGRSQA